MEPIETTAPQSSTQAQAAPVAPTVETRKEYTARVVVPAQARADAALGNLRAILQNYVAALPLETVAEPKVLTVLRHLCQPWDYLFHDGDSTPCLPYSPEWDDAETEAINACKMLARAQNRADLLPE
jgi:hypothetical protein